MICPSCGQENPVGLRLCGMCGTLLVDTAPPRQERKVLTVLFADLVGFTSRAEQLDPEDVRALLGPYWERLREELEGDFVRAAEIAAEHGFRVDEAELRLRAAEALVAEGRRAEADVQLGRALAFFRSVGAARYVREGEALLAATA